MVKAVSPLRYPGGKVCLYPLLCEILRINNLHRRRYAEPFAGGGGLALALLYSGVVSDIHLNDFDPAVWAFWYSAINHNDEFIHLVSNTPLTIDEWKRQRLTNLKQDTNDLLSLGFSTFYLNRTNRSGIIKGAGVIGGLNQDGNYKMDCRFNRDDLIRRLERIYKYREQINVTNLDAIQFIESYKYNTGDILMCIDPPYFNKGKGLYTSFYEENDHKDLSILINNIETPWILTYDDTPEIRELYKRKRIFEFDINYSIETKRKGTEILVPSSGLRIPDCIKNRASSSQKELEFI
ncbi:DNA adenine methylase [Gluconobacter albidus]|uniref:DNA adenine methylase n=1 Tax=Gluconobacter albidus TaxID=318683 RepID=UPI001FC9978E|nr:DNA adenine methylase [Gluconobacter albidus]